MLTSLKVKNYALIKELELHLGSGFNVISGETGAGKSILLGALGLILGQRADTNSLNDPSRKCAVEATFDTTQLDFSGFFEKHDLDEEEPVIIRREINPSGKSRAFINDTPVTLQVLRELGNQLVDIHAQHQTLRLNDSDFQLSILDHFAGHASLLTDYKTEYQEYTQLKQKLQKLREQEQQTKKDYDYYLYQANELDEAALQQGELEELEKEHATLSNAETIKGNLQQALQMLYDHEQSIQNQFAEVNALLRDVAKHHEQINALQQRIESVEIEVKDIADEASDINDQVTVDDGRLQEVNERLQLIHQLLNKHGHQTIEELLEYHRWLKEQVASSESIDEEIRQAEEALEAQKQKLQDLANQLTANRKGEIPQVESALVENLQFVGIPDAQVKIDLTQPAEQDYHASGQDQIQILFTANKGQSPKPIAQVASGGELSRLMLCIKYLLANAMLIPTIIFDEIDMGISGEVAIKVGQLMKQLANHHQVINITHLPQVAAMGNHHFLVYKESGANETFTQMQKLEGEERVEAIAKMMAGSSASSSAYQNARELIENH